jgi:hypothetical protein
MKSIVNSVCVSLSSLFLFAGATQAQNLIQNGSFELPGFAGNAVPGQQQRVVAYSTDITGWTVGGIGDVYVHKYPVGPASSFGPAEDGSYYLDLSGDGRPHATVYQDFSTTIGSEYSLSFYIGSASSQPSSTINVGLLGTGTLLDTTLTPLPPDGNGINWLQETFSFTSDSTVTRLSFVDMSAIDDNASFVDNVYVSEVPEPTTLLPMGMIALAIWRRR